LKATEEKGRIRISKPVIRHTDGCNTGGGQSAQKHMYVLEEEETVNMLSRYRKLVGMVRYRYLSGDEDVGGLHVPVDDLVVVDEEKALEHLLHHLLDIA
jgi:hypothetical protein